MVAIRYRFLLWQALIHTIFINRLAAISFISKQFQWPGKRAVPWHKRCDLSGCDLSEIGR